MKSFKIFVSLLLVLMLFAGCSSERNNLKDLSVVEGMGIDYKDGEIRVTVQTLNLAKEGSGAEALSGNVTMNTSGSGKNISTAIENVKESLSKELFFGQNRLIVFGMNMAENYLNTNLDYLLRSADSRMDIAVCISENEAEEVMESKENDALVPSQSVTSLLEIGEKGGFGAYVTVKDVLNLYLDKTSDIYLPVIKAGEKSVSAVGIAVYNEEKLVKVLDSSSTFGFLFLSNKISTGLLDIENEELGKIGINIISSKTKTKASVENGKVVYHADIKVQLMLDAVEKGLVRSLSRDDLDGFEKLAEEKISDYCKAAFTDCTSQGSDSLRIGEHLAMSCPKDYAVLSDNWGDVIKNAVLDVSVKCELKKINDNTSED